MRVNGLCVFYRNDACFLLSASINELKVRAPDPCPSARADTRDPSHWGVCRVDFLGRVSSFPQAPHLAKKGADAGVETRYPAFWNPALQSRE